MRKRPGSSRHPGPGLALVAVLSLLGMTLGLLSVSTGARAQEPCELCPTPALTVEPSSRRMMVTWNEVAETDGRATSNLTFENWDFDSSSVFTVIGDYVGDCDYRLTITKIPRDPGFAQQVQLVYRIAINTTGTGAPVAIDTLDVFQPNTSYFFEPAIAGNLGVSVTPNADQPPDLGGSVVTVGGVYTGTAKRASFRATALNSVSVLSDSLRVEVRGPLAATRVLRDTLTVTGSSQVFPIMSGLDISFGDPAPTGITAGQTTTWAAHYVFPSTGRIKLDIETFEGYHLWRSDLPDLEDFSLLGEIRPCESKREFVLVDETELMENDIRFSYDSVARVFQVVDTDIHDDFPYRYAVSTFDRGFLGNIANDTFEGTLTTSPKIYPARPVRTAEQEAFVVPNPFKQSADWQEGGAKVVFANLPEECTIRLFTVAADHIATLHHRYPSEPRSTSATSATWDLTTDRGEAIVPGIYIYYIEGTSEPFEQTGKMIVVR